MQKLFAQHGEGDVTPAGDHVIGKPNDFLLAGLMRDFWPAKYHRHLRRYALEQGNDAREFIDIPDIHAKTDDLRLHCE